MHTHVIVTRHCVCIFRDEGDHHDADMADAESVVASASASATALLDGCSGWMAQLCTLGQFSSDFTGVNGRPLAELLSGMHMVSRMVEELLCCGGSAPSSSASASCSSSYTMLYYDNNDNANL